MTLSTSTKIFLLLLTLPILTQLVLLHYGDDGNNNSPPPLDHGTGSMFDLIATRYDFINRALALNLDIGWRKVMISHVLNAPSILAATENDDDENVRILDLATGTADVAILLAKQFQSTHQSNNNNNPIKLQILGVDPSANMIQVGNQKLDKQHLNQNVKLQLGDARNLHEVEGDNFHAATMSFGIRNVPEKDLVLCEIHRTLIKADDGDKSSRLAILEFSEPDPAESGIMGYAARAFIRHIVPVLGAILSGAPKEYLHLQNSIKEFPSPKDFVKLMEGVRCTDKDTGDSNEDGDGGKTSTRVGTFVVEDLIQMNFGSVQLYLAKPVYL